MLFKDTSSPISPINLLLLLFLITLVAGTAVFYNAGNGGLGLIGFYFVLSQVFLGTFVFIQNPKAKINFYFALFSYCLALWNYFAILIFRLPLTQPFYWVDWVIYIPAILMIYYLFYFSVVFPAEKKYFSETIHWLTLIIPIGLIAVLLAEHDLIINGVAAIDGTRAPVFGQGYSVFVLYVMSYMAAVMFNLRQSYKDASLSEKAQLLYFILGAVIAILGFLATNLILPWSTTASLEWMGSLFSLVFLAFTAYAIVKAHLMDISVVISRSLAEIVTIIFLGSLFLGIAWICITYLSSQIGLVFLSISIIYGIIVGHTYERVRLFFQTTSDKLFLHGKYNYYRSLSDASARVGQKLSLENILQVLYETFHEVVEISNPRVFLPESFTEVEKNSNCYLVYDKQTYQPMAAGQKIAMDSPLVRELIATRKPVLDVKELDAALAVPCLLEDRLIAIFALGHKLSEDAYTDEDLRLLEVLANQAAITLDHTRSYEKIRTDLESMERELERSQRLASIGTLTAGVTHEIRNPLTVIRAETERLANQERDQAYLRQYSDLVLKHVDRIAGIVQRMLGLAKEKTRREVEINLTELLDSTTELFVISNITVQKNLNPLPPIKGDPEEMQEVFVNLIQNALEAMPQGGKLTLSAFIEDHRSVIEISDTGKGIPEELRERIFDPFFSSRHEGVGLGLSIVYRIVREHGGDIKVTSEVGKGSTFKLLF